MSSQIKNVIVIGAGGDLGTPVLDAILASSSFNVSVLSRASSNATFPSNVTVHRSDYSPESLEKIFKGQDAVVSTVGGTAIPDQKKMIDAAVAAGVKRFIPSEFGANTADKNFCELFPALSVKADLVSYLREKEASGMTWTSVISGPFFDWCLKNGMFGIDHSKQIATLVDDGVRPINSTTLPMVGRTVVEILLRPDQTVNRYIYVASFTFSQRELLAVVERLSGKKYEVQRVSGEEKRRIGGEKLAKGDMSGFVDMLIGAVIASLDKKEPLDNEMLGLPKQDMDTVVKETLGL